MKPAKPTPPDILDQLQDQVAAIQKAYPGIADTPALRDQLAENQVLVPQSTQPIGVVPSQQRDAPISQLVVDIAVIAPGVVVEWTKGRFAGALGHVIAIDGDSVIFVQQPCDYPGLRWFSAPIAECKVIGRAAGRYKIPDAEIQKNIERLKPKPRKLEDFDALL